MKQRILVARAVLPEVVESLATRFEVEHNAEDRPWPPDELASRVEVASNDVRIGESVAGDGSACAFERADWLRRPWRFESDERFGIVVVPARIVCDVVLGGGARARQSRQPSQLMRELFGAKASTPAAQRLGSEPYLQLACRVLEAALRESEKPQVRHDAHLALKRFSPEYRQVAAQQAREASLTGAEPPWRSRRRRRKDAATAAT